MSKIFEVRALVWVTVNFYWVWVGSEVRPGGLGQGAMPDPAGQIWVRGQTQTGQVPVQRQTRRGTKDRMLSQKGHKMVFLMRKYTFNTRDPHDQVVGRSAA